VLDLKIRQTRYLSEDVHFPASHVVHMFGSVNTTWSQLFVTVYVACITEGSWRTERLLEWQTCVEWLREFELLLTIGVSTYEHLGKLPYCA
jgi:hypothetical protein